MNTYDSPSDVAAAMTGSLAAVMDVLSPDSKKKGVYNIWTYTCNDKWQYNKEGKQLKMTAIK